MDPLTFAQRVIASLAWPLTVLVLATIFRKSIKDVLDRIFEVRWKRLMIVKLARNLEQAKAAPIEEPADPPVLGAKSLPRPKKPQKIERSIPPPLTEFEAERVKSGRPRVGKAAIHGCWKGLNAAIMAVAEEHGLDTTSAVTAVRRLRESEVLSDEFSGVFNKLKSSYKYLEEAPHWVLQSKLAEDFVESCERLTDFMEQLR